MRTIARLLLTAAGLLLVAPSAPSAEPGPTSDPFALAAPMDFASAVALVERATGVRGDKLADVPLDQGRSFDLEPKVAARLLAGSHGTFLGAGLYLFRYERSYGMPGENDRVALLATTDRAVVVRRIGTAGAGQSPTTEEIVAWLDRLAKDEPFELWEIGTDYVAGRFARTPKDPAAVARRCAEIAPDLVGARASTVDLLAAEIRANRTLYLIW
jgi:hypothetical protein